MNFLGWKSLLHHHSCSKNNCWHLNYCCSYCLCNRGRTTSLLCRFPQEISLWGLRNTKDATILCWDTHLHQSHTQPSNLIWPFLCIYSKVLLMNSANFVKFEFGILASKIHYSHCPQFCLLQSARFYLNNWEGSFNIDWGTFLRCLIHITLYLDIACSLNGLLWANLRADSLSFSGISAYPQELS